MIGDLCLLGAFFAFAISLVAKLIVRVIKTETKKEGNDG
jgi:hypothetical protein